MRHDLKIWPQYFCRVQDGSKTFEVRKNDRGFQPGDTVVLREWDPKIIEHRDEWGPSGQCDYYDAPRGYSGRVLVFSIGYVLPIDSERVAFSLLPATKED